MTLDYGKYGIFLIMGNAGYKYIYTSSTVSARLDRVLVKSRRLGRPWKGGLVRATKEGLGLGG